MGWTIETPNQSTGITQPQLPYGAPSSESIGWSQFCGKLDRLDLTRMDPTTESLKSRIIDTNFGDFRIRRVGGNGCALRCERSRSRIEYYPEDLIWICLVLKGDLRITQHRVTAELTAGDLALVDSLQTYSIDVPQTSVDTLWVGAPRANLAEHIWGVDDLLGVTIDGGGGIVRMAARILHTTFVGDGALAAAEANRIAGAVMDVLGTAVDSCRLRQAGSRYRAQIVRRIKNYIEDHLGDETLTVAEIAKHEGMSRRYLASLFENEAETVSSWIWSRRLERCRQALLHGNAARSISEIAYDHGFKNVSHFSRTFKERYGQSPRSLLSRS